jgi:hypothetical protein
LTTGIVNPIEAGFSSFFSSFFSSAGLTSIGAKRGFSGAEKRDFSGAGVDPKIEVAGVSEVIPNRGFSGAAAKRGFSGAGVGAVLKANPRAGALSSFFLEM